MYMATVVIIVNRRGLGIGIDTSPLIVSLRCIRHQFTVTVIKSSCTRVTRRSASVTRVDVVYVNVCISRHLKGELAWVIDKRLWLIINKMLFKTVIPLRI